ncbi:hypothetical protein QWZ10_17850 [Paracoccus cavernae]|uniref:Uncharacterized protein n=1 Tax=Paracoccus cavernae TaxID=1571207 RepID=A0ABT8DCF7_9RHOB|nr:hypothetical protein [Paracoccus cavernae]
MSLRRFILAALIGLTALPAAGYEAIDALYGIPLRAQCRPKPIPPRARTARSAAAPPTGAIA